MSLSQILEEHLHQNNKFLSELNSLFFHLENSAQIPFRFSQRPGAGDWRRKGE